MDSIKKVTFNFTASEVSAAKETAYKQNAEKYNVQGFRKGKAPKAIIEKNYGDVFTESAIGDLFSNAYSKHLADNPDIKPIDYPTIDVKEKDGGFEITATIEVEPKFTLGKYTGLEVKAAKISVTDKDIDGFLEKMVADRVRLLAADEGHKIKTGDVAVIDFVGSIDGVEFPGGSAKNHQLEIGTKSFIDTFEDQLVGKAAGDKVDVKVSFPKEYHATELAGKPALFKVEVRNILIKQFPKLDDTLAKEASEFESLAEFRADIRKRMEAQAEIEQNRMSEDALVEAVVTQTKVDVPKKLTDREYQHMISNLTNSLAKQGLTIEQYFQYMNVQASEFEKKQREFAEIGAKTRLVLVAIMEKENINDFEGLIKFLQEKNKFVYTSNNQGGGK